MKVLLSWLREFAPLEGEPEEIADQLSGLGLTVEEMTLIGGGLDGVVVAQVLELRSHPDADRIQLVDVDSGDGKPLQICCGAFNMKIGDFVPLATLGTTMNNGMEISRRKMRGEWSNGMLCSASEIGLGIDSEGIMVLDSSLEAGTPLKEALQINDDVLFDLEVNPNRPDAMSVAGVARDLAALQGEKFSLPKPKPEEKGDSIDGRLGVEIIDKDLCGRFAVRVLDGITIEPSPQWVSNRLISLGMRPINNVVDASNYVMLELGQPSHTYDLDRVQGAGFRVRRAYDGEQIVTLDGVERDLNSSDGVVADANDTAIGIAGVMGGATTEIDEETKTVALEMAWWDPISISATARKLGLRSEASSRFERGADPEIAELAMKRFAEILSPSGASVAPGMVDVRGHLPERPNVRVRTDRVNNILGTDLSTKKITEILKSIEFKVSKSGKDLDVEIPSFRFDSTTEIDVIEEIARLYGYANIPRTVPQSTVTGGLTERQKDRRIVKNTMVGLGVDEVMPVPFLAPGDLEAAGLKVDGITVTNPLVAEESVMRASLRPGLLKTLAYNSSHRITGLKLFELGHVYKHPESERPLPDEREHLGVVLSGGDAGSAVRIWSALADSLALREYDLVADGPPGLHATRTARIDVDGQAVGFVGEISPSVLKAYGVSERVGWLEVDLDTALQISHGDKPYKPISRYPSSDVDLAFEVPEDVTASAVGTTLRAAAGELLVGLQLFDVFRGQPVKENCRSLAYTLRFQATDRTLTDSEVSEVRERCISAVESELSASLRA
ncbi:MAG: Phenylalanine--tRNA ligase beta subunit [Acidimicrobiales bacterium AG-410-I20]|nr:MAG: Phenylalanine--tRNA ligase beta subunit [Acidimicrobiales bacterium AG-410-I20]